MIGPSPSLTMTLLITALAAAPGTSFARDSIAQKRATAFQAVLDCRVVADTAARLACYDAAAGNMSEAETRGDIVVIDRAQASAAHREAFGLPLPSLDFVTKALRPDEADSVTGVIRSLRADANGRWTMTLEDGARWRQIDGDLLRPPHAGSKVSIHKGMLGSFVMNVDGQPGVKVHRDQ